MTLGKLASGLFVAAAMASVAMPAKAAVVVPVKAYAHPDEAIVVKFLNENEQGKAALQKIGLAAVALDGLFTPVPAGEVVADGKPAFDVYTFAGKKLEATPGEAARPDGSVDVAALFPQVKETGTYVLLWKDAPPLVIESLANPLGPLVTHIVPLQYGVITTDHGAIKVKFAYDVAPHTVDNFISLSDQKFYDGSAFHRILAGFMIQGGDPLANTPRAGTGGPGYKVGAEFSSKTHQRGVLSMARSSDPDSAGSQFFIVHQKSAHLDGQYTAFGDVLDADALKVVDEIAATPADPQSGSVTGEKPKIESIRILPATAKMYGIGDK